MEDSLNGFCTPPLRRAEFLQLIGNKAHRLIPRYVITQSSGRQRVISTTATPGDNQPCHLTPTSLPCAVLCDQRNTSAYDASMVGGGRRRFLLAWRLGDRPRRSTLSLQVLPYVTARELGLRCGMVPSRMADPGISSLCRSTFWASAGSDFL